MNLIVNGQEHATEQSLSVAELVDSIIPVRRGVAVAVNGTVVPKSTWADVPLADGDAVEVLTAAQGG